MTKLDRELAIADNIAYIRDVLAQLPRRGSSCSPDFPQGASMAAPRRHIPCAGLILLGGDVPAEVKTDGARFPQVLLAGNARRVVHGGEVRRGRCVPVDAHDVTQCVLMGPRGDAFARGGRGF
jgi:hypothetical protein